MLSPIGAAHARGTYLMMSDYKTPEEIRCEGLEALVVRLGPADAIRFIQQYEQGQGDYTRDRHEWLDSIRASC